MSTTVNEVIRPEELESLGKPPHEAKGLAARLYTDPEVFAAEKQKIFRREWMPVFHESTVREPGDYRVVDVAGDSLVFVRGEDGVLRGFHNICRHRGAKVAPGAEGRCARFRCPYHNWTYDLEGRLIGAPTLAHVVREGIGLVELRLELWMGFVFVNLDGQAEPLADKLTELAEEVAPWLASDLEVLYEIPYRGHWNWKLTFENAIEGYHVIGSHADSAQWLLPGELTYTSREEFTHFTDYRMPFQNPHNMRDGTGGSVAFDDLPEWVDTEARFYPVWPMFLFYVAPDNVTATFAIPGAGPDEVTFVWCAVVRPESRMKPTFEKFRREQIEWSNVVQGEDQYPCETMWANVHSDAFIPGPYADGERAVYHFDQWYLQRMSQ